MASHPVSRHLIKRQVDASTANGIDDVASTDTGTATQTALAVASTTPIGASQAVPNLVLGSTPITTIETPTGSDSPPTATATPSQASGSNPIPLGTVIGACVGAFIGAAILIVLGVFFYKRHTRSLNLRARSRRALGTPRNFYGEQSRRRSHLEPWNKLEEGDDKWEGMYQTKEIDTVAPMEKLTMFQKSPSVRTAYTQKSDEPPVTFDVHPFAQYHPDVARELASADEKKQTDLPIARQFLGRVDTGPAISWDGETIGDDSFLSIRSGHMSGSAQTPPLTTSQLHRWESAEVVQYEHPQPTVVHNPPAHNSNNTNNSSERRRSASNPFFSSSSAADFTTRSRSNSTRSRSNSLRSTRSHSTVKAEPMTPTPKVDKGKQRAIEDPFTDDQLPSFPRPFIPVHSTSASQSSAASNDRALQSLIAALDVTEEDIQERLRVASLQPSFISAYTADDEDVTGSFPLPPSTDGGHRKAL